METTTNMKIYEQAAIVPEEAKKTITGGKLNGMTDINPMWRIKKMTEIFGVCGIGWKYVITSKETHAGAQGEIICTVDIELYIKNGEVWSDAIPGTGGSKLSQIEKGNLATNDEAFKMALTDALSVAMKALGVGASVYFSKDRTKYTASDESELPPMLNATVPKPNKVGKTPTTANASVQHCAACKTAISDKVAEYSLFQFGRPLCMDCQKKEKKL